MFAQRMRPKESEVTFVSYPGEDLLSKVRFVSRFYSERDREPEDCAAGAPVPGGASPSEAVACRVYRFNRAGHRQAGCPRGTRRKAGTAPPASAVAPCLDTRARAWPPDSPPRRRSAPSSLRAAPGAGS